MALPPKTPPRFVPTLTEVVHVPPAGAPTPRAAASASAAGVAGPAPLAASPSAARSAAPMAAPAPRGATPTPPVSAPPPVQRAPAAVAPSHGAPVRAPAVSAPPLAMRVLPDGVEEHMVHRVMQRVDVVLDQRLREAIATVVQEQTRSVLPRLREEIESVVRHAVYEAVADELASGAAPGPRR